MGVAAPPLQQPIPSAEMLAQYDQLLHDYDGLLLREQRQLVALAWCVREIAVMVGYPTASPQQLLQILRQRL